MINPFTGENMSTEERTQGADFEQHELDWLLSPTLDPQDNEELPF